MRRRQKAQTFWAQKKLMSKEAKRHEEGQPPLRTVKNSENSSV